MSIFRQFVQNLDNFLGDYLHFMGGCYNKHLKNSHFSTNVFVYNSLNDF